jgi:general secretion pathway protein G
MVRSSPLRARDAFTLLELLVAIAIVVLLAGLLLSAVNKVLVYAEEVRTVYEVGKLSEALELFRSEFGLYPPSRIQLFERGTPPDPYSAQYLTRMFSGIDLDLYVTSGGSLFHDWNGNGVADPQPYALEGQECLVLFLGGPPYQALGGAPSGWHTDKTFPTRPPTPTATRLGPFFEMNLARLGNMADQNDFDPVRHIWRGYKDPYGTPYAYFLARDTSFNNYVNDCPSLCGIAFQPYWMSPPTPTPNAPVKYHRPDKFQLISAGRDRRFGTGGHYDPARPQLSHWNPAASAVADLGRPNNPGLPDRVQDDYDNITNFSEGKLVP